MERGCQWRGGALGEEVPLEKKGVRREGASTEGGVHLERGYPWRRGALCETSVGRSARGDGIHCEGWCLWIWGAYDGCRSTRPSGMGLEAKSGGRRAGVWI